MAFPWQVMYQNPPRDQLGFVFYRLVGTYSEWYLSNNTATDLVIASLYQAWPPGNVGLFDIDLDGNNIYSGFDPASPTFIDSGWAGSVSDRTLFAKSSLISLKILYGNVPAASPYDTIVTFTNGWSTRVTK